MKNRKIMCALCVLLLAGTTASAQEKTSKKMLIAYYSLSGNTRTVAENIRKITGADVFEIEPAVAYPSDYQSVVDQARKEISANYRPALKSMVKDMDQYDIIFVGSPCWWATVAPPVATFLASSDLAGKTIVPFMTHEGSRMGHSEDDIRKLCPKSTVLKGLPVRGGSAASSESAIRKWLQDLDLDGGK